MKAPKKTSIFFADEQTLLREGLRQICEATGRFRVVGHCGDGRSAVKMIRTLWPDIAVLDLGLPKMYAPAVIQAVRQGGVSLKVLVLSMRRDRKTVLEVLRGGANGYLLKSDPVACLLQGLDDILSGGIYISPQFKPAEVFAAKSGTLPLKPYERLSTREHQVFTMLVDGLRTKDIANHLDLSPKTISTYRTNLMAKLSMHDVPALVKFAIRRNLIPLG